jgi:hypothetical protein
MAITDFPFRIGPINNITPFTYRDGVTYLEILYKLRDYINLTLRPEFDAEMERIIEEFNAGIANAEAHVDETSATLTALVNTTNAALTALVNEARQYVDDETAEARQYVDDAIEFINNKTGNVEIQRATLTGPYTLNIDPLWPTNHPVRFVLTQDATGNRSVTLGANIVGPLNVHKAANSSTLFELVPNGDGTWDVVQDDAEYEPINLAVRADPTGVADSTAIIQAAFDEAAALAQAGGGTRKVVFGSSAFVKQPTYLINGRVVLEEWVVAEAETGMIRIKCGTATAGIDVGNGTDTPYHAELNNILVDANFIADNPVVFNKVSEVYSRRLFVTNLTDAGQGIKLHNCLGVTLENPSISRNSVQPHGIGVGIRFTGTSAGYVVVRDHNFFNLKDAFRFETGVSSLNISEGWNEWITNYHTVAVTAFASFGQLVTENSHFTGTDAIHRLFYLEKADNGYGITNFDVTKFRMIGANVTSALIDISAVANTAGITKFTLDKGDWSLGANATVLSKHASTPWHQTFVRIRYFNAMPFAKLPVQGTDCQLTAQSHQGWDRFANGVSVNGDTARTDGHIKWNSTTKRLSLDILNNGVYHDIPVSGDYISGALVADKSQTFAAGSYYSPNGARSTFATIENRMTVVPFHVPKTQQFTRIGVEVTTAAAGSTIRLGIYNIGPTGLPSTLVLDAGTIDSSVLGAAELTIDVTLVGGLYGLAAVAQGGTPAVRTLTGGGGISVGGGSLASVTQSNPNTGFYQNNVSGTLPANYTLTDRSLAPTLVAVKTA